MSSPTKILFLAMDAGDKVLIEKWAVAGVLPNFKSLFDNGLVGDTKGLEGFFVGSTWPSFYTGVTPARHGFHSLLGLDPGTYKFSRSKVGAVIKQDPFWVSLCRAGKTVAVLDIPLSSISNEIRGMQMVEWGSHDSGEGFATWPPHLEADVLNRFGVYPASRPCNEYGRTPRDFRTFRNTLIEAVRRKTALTNHYLRKGGWDLFAQVFTEGHCAGHQCWHLHDPNHPNYDPALASYVGDLILDVYKAIDQAIGELLSLVDRDTTFIFLASHRMAHFFGAQFMLPEILTRLGVAKSRSSAISNAAFSGPIKGLNGLLHWGWRLTPHSIKNLLAPTKAFLQKKFEGDRFGLPPLVSGLDLENSRCFPMVNGFPVSGLRVNLVHREPHGCVRAGGEMDDFCFELAEALLGIVYRDTGAPAIKSVTRTDQLYQGPCSELLPDLLIEWNDDMPLPTEGAGRSTKLKTRLYSPIIGNIEGLNRYCRTGDHRPEGLYIAMGPGIDAGRLEKPVSIMDFAPTLCGLLGVQLTGIDGKPITEIMHHC